MTLHPSQWPPVDLPINQPCRNFPTSIFRQTLLGAFSAVLYNLHIFTHPYHTCHHSEASHPSHSVILHSHKLEIHLKPLTMQAILSTPLTVLWYTMDLVVAPSQPWLPCFSVRNINFYYSTTVTHSARKSFTKRFVIRQSRLWIPSFALFLVYCEIGCMYACIKILHVAQNVMHVSMSSNCNYEFI